ncbi:MAG: bifunctional 2-polyprenyl-6-hydroxyphenol methylase/3-demethylubiquinol 3-O-methyltransferase UbiG, partial [Alphaproteobacteria bacterium]|nr:bifunctional 2-polyprenyl-6-hydroxyphenol methylase/3-demethylubiquinol 3-O-methyltransferase UbiG [Alphaproteobacteria bacterium]
MSEKSDDPRGSQRLAASIDPAELEKFAAMADEWWDPNGKFRPLHQLAPVRLAFIRREFGRQFGVDEKQPEPLRGRRVLDIGCGGGLISEPMARLGGTVTGVDAVEKNIAIARAHAAGMGLDIDYRTGTAEQMEAAGDGGFDLILNL